MKLILTSLEFAGPKKLQGGAASRFYRMPPVGPTPLGTAFMPDYATLLLCDKLVIDKLSFDALTKPHRSFKDVSETMMVLYSEGFVELVDFHQILSDNEELLKRMLELKFCKISCST